MIHYDTNSTPPPAANVVLASDNHFKIFPVFCFNKILYCILFINWDITFSVMLPSIYSMHNKSVNIRTLIELWL